MEKGAIDLVNIILKPENMAVVVGVWVIITTAKKAVPEFMSHPILVRILPVIPIVLCVAAMWLPGVGQTDMAVGDKILLGLLLGFAVGHAHKVVKQAGMGKDARINPPA